MVGSRSWGFVAAVVYVVSGCGGSRPQDAVEQVSSALNLSVPGRGSGLLWRLPSGELRLWDMLSGSAYKEVSVGSADITQWRPVATGDFNGDGAGDIFWHNQGANTVVLWAMTDTRVTTNTAATADGPNFSLNGGPYAGDLDGDGVSDLIWTSTKIIFGGPTLFLTRTAMMNAGSTVPRSVTTSQSTTERVQGVGNFDGDSLRRADVLRRTTSGNVSIAISGGSTIQLGNVATSWVIKGVGDFNADGTSDIIWYNTSSGQVSIWVMQNGLLSSSAIVGTMPPGDGWVFQGLADADKDGISDIIWRHNGLAVVSIWTMAGPTSVREFGPGLTVNSATTFAGVVDLGPPSPPTSASVVDESWLDGRIQVRVQFTGQAQRPADQVELWESFGGNLTLRQRVQYHREFAPNIMQATFDTTLLQGGAQACFQLRIWEQGRVSPTMSNQICAPGLAPPVANWDWRVHDEFGLDDDRDGSVDVTPSSNAIARLHARQSLVTLDACTTARDPANGTIVNYAWNLQLPTGPLTINTSTCQRTGLTFPQVPFSATLTVTTHDGRRASVTRTIAPKNQVIVSLGDSFASGEGNPVRDIVWDRSGGSLGIQSPAYWGRQWDAVCHRTANAGPARAALALERADPYSSVMFFSAACSGAVVANIIDTPQTWEGRGTITQSQIQQVRNLLCPRISDVTVNANCHPSLMPAIDALLISIGGNDVEFSDIIETCILQPNPISTARCGVDPDFLRPKDARLAEMPDKLTRLRQALSALNVSRTYITEYPDGVHIDASRVCDEVVFENAITDGTFGVGILAGQIDGVIGHDDLVWAADFIDRLNQTTQSTVAGFASPWTFVSGIDLLFNTHGYCLDADHFMTRYEESKQQQGDQFGAMHPNIGGHNAYAKRILASFLGTLTNDKRVVSFIPAGKVVPPINP